MPTIITRTIDAGGGGDYTTFTAAEAAVVTLVTTDDMVGNDEAIVFECVAGTYSETFAVDSSSPGPALTMDATRNITFKAAAGSEHDGTSSTGARLIFDDTSPGSIVLTDDFVTIDGLVCTTDTGAVGNRGLIRDNANGTTVRNCVLDVQHSTPWTIWNNGGAQTVNCVYENNVLKTVASVAAIAINTIGAVTAGVELTNNTIWRDPAAGADRALFYQTLTGGQLTVTATNNFIFGVSNWSTGNTSGGGVLTMAGSGNFIDVVGSNMGVGVALMEGTTTTDPLAASTGSQVIYDATTGALVNAPGNDAVGVCGVTGIPTTDINGEDRIRDTHADPGAFVAPLRTIAKSIDAAGGGDYTTFTAAEAAVSTLPTDVDMVQRNEAVVFEAEAGTYSESVTFDSSTPGPALTVDATRNITYRAAAGSEHGGDLAAGVRITSSGTPLTCKDAFMRIEQLVAVTTGSFAVNLQGNGPTADACIAKSDGTACFLLGQDVGPSAQTVTNCVAVSGATYGVWCNPPGVIEVTNCTVLQSAGTGIRISDSGSANAVQLTNNVVLSDPPLAAYAATGTPIISGSNNVGGATGPFPAALQASSQTWTFSTDPLAASTGSLAIYDATNGAMVNAPGNDAVGVGTSTGAPATDILGKDRLRGAYADPGAFTTDLVTTTRTIDAAGGGDYTTFTAAEAAVSTLPTAVDMVKRNEAIVFDAVAGTYNESVTFDSSTPGPALTMDATRNITYRAAAGSEHGGVSRAGVDLAAPLGSSFAARVFDKYCRISGLSLYRPDGTPLRFERRDGAVLEGCLLSSGATVPGTIGADIYGSQNAAAPQILRNNVFNGTNTSYEAVQVKNFGASPTYADLLNNTMVQGFLAADAISGDLVLSLVNNIVLSTGGAFNQTGSFGVTVSGSGNVGGATNPFPVAQQASSQTWTFSTDPLAASTGSQVIYDATNGAMVDAPGNDAWHLLTDLSVAPTTDIEGVTREATGYNPGAFERTAADVGTPLDGGVDYLRDLNIRDRFLRGAAIREPFLRNLRG